MHQSWAGNDGSFAVMSETSRYVTGSPPQGMNLHGLVLEGIIIKIVILIVEL